MKSRKFKQNLEDKSKESEQNFKILLENLPQKIFLKDKNLVYISCNKHYADDLKIKLDEIKGKTDYKFYPKKLAEKYRKDDKKIMKAGKTVDIEEEYIKDGQKLFVHTVKTPIKDRKGKIIGVLGIFWDITKQKKAEEKLLYFKKAVEESSDAIGMSTPKGKHYYQNAAFDKLFKLSVTEVEGKKGPAASVYADEKVGREVFKTIMGGNSWTGEVEMLAKGIKIPVLLRAYPIKDEKGEIIGLIGVHTNITERKKAEEILKKTNEELKKLDKIKSNFLNIVSHEMKTPLTAINAHLGVLDDLKTNLNEQELLSLGAIKRNNYLLKTLIDNILELSRIESGNFELNLSNINLERIIMEVKSNLEILSEKKGLQLMINVGKLPEVFADEMRIREILNNLISNSIKFTDKGWIKVGAEKKDNHVVIRVIDTGIGIPKNKMNNLFQKFYQVDSSIGRRYGGTGLGLAITKQLIELQGGKINVKSVYGKGSTFSVLLPINNHILKGGAK